MWLILCFFLLYLSIGIGIISKLDRGDFDIDPYEMKVMNWSSDKGYISKKLKKDFTETINSLIIFVIVWPIAIIVINKDMNEERERYFGKDAPDRRRSR